MIKKPSYWNSRLGLYLAAVGVSFGLGNVWRFPYVMSENGGAGFLFLYILMTGLIGLPLLLAEFILGKSTGLGLIESVSSLTQSLSPRRGRIYVFFSKFPVFFSFILVAYYAVISGWVLYFSVQFLMQIFLYSQVPVSVSGFLMDHGILQISLVSVHLLLAFLIVGKEVQDGLERWVSYLIPFFAILVLALVIKSLSLPSAGEAVRFLLYPDFSKLTLSSLGRVVGHVLFTMSVGVGIMVTFGSYMREQDNVPAAGLRVALADIFMSIMVGFLVFPIIIASGAEISSPIVFFETISQYFFRLEWGVYFGFFFFLCLYMASLGGTIAILETVIANVTEHRRMDRKKAIWIMGSVSFVMSSVIALSGRFSDWLSLKEDLFVWIDGTLINWLLPIGALWVLFIVVSHMGDDVRKQHFVDESRAVTVNLYRDWFTLLKWVVPGVIVLGLFLQVYSIFM